MLFKRFIREPELPYDPQTQIPILKCSICNGEQVAGFKDIQTGKFHEEEMIQNQEQLQLFMQRCRIDHIDKEY